MQYSVVNYKTVKENSSFRIDADFFRPDYLEILDELQNRKHESLKNKDRRVFSGPFGSFLKSESYQKSGHPFIRISDIKDVYIEKEGMVYLNDDEFERVKKYQLDVNDIVFSKIGTVGRLSLITEELGKVAISENNIGIKFSRNIETKNRFYIFILLLSKYGQKQIFRLSSGNVQPKLNVSDIENLNLPIASDNFVEKIYQLVLSSQSKYQSSKSLYSQAEQLLLSELELLGWKQKHELTFVKNFADTRKAERFDAEYFQPKYEEIIGAVKKYKGGFDTIGEQFTLSKKSFKKIDDREYRYIEIGCVNISDGTMEAIILQGSELPANAKIKLQKNDVIISKVRPYRGAIGIVDNDDFVGSGAFTVLGENGIINKETLMVFLRLKPLLDFSLKFNVGTSYPVITDEDILNFLLPKIIPEIQNQIKEKIIEMYETKKLSKSLLEIAKRGVEMAIEKNEQEAEKWINGELAKLEIKL